MKLPKGTNPARVCSSDDTRHVIQHVSIDDGHAVATDGRTMLVMKVEMEASDARGEVLIHKDIVNDAVKAADRIGEVTSLCIGESEFTFEDPRKGREIAAKDEGTGKFNYPTWRAVIPDDRPRLAISINPSLLRRIVKAMGIAGYNGVTLHVVPEDVHAPIIITQPEKADRFGILMPMNPRVSVPTLAENQALRWSRSKERIEAAKAACAEAGEFWTEEKEASIAGKEPSAP